MSSRTPAPAKQKWYVQVKETYSFTKQNVSALGLKLFAIFAVIFAVIEVIGVAIGHPVYFGLLAFGTALLVTTYVFGKIAEKSAYESIKGQLGAAASVLQSLPARSWAVTPAVGVDKNQNLVHRVVGRPGIILVGEGGRPAPLLAEQRKAHQRIVPGAPIQEFIVGEGGLTLPELPKALRKLKKQLRPRDVTELRRRVEAMPKNILPIPKGPLPTGRKVPRR